MISALRTPRFGVTQTAMWTKGSGEVSSGFCQVLWGKPVALGPRVVSANQGDASQGSCSPLSRLPMAQGQSIWED